MDIGQLSVSIISLVAIISLVLSLITLFAYAKLKNSKLLFVFSAFLVFFIKCVYVSLAIAYDIVEHKNLELHSSLFDLLVVLMLFIPFLMPYLKKRGEN
jgi:hypothetical protein